MPKYCVVTHCNSESNLQEGISLHTIPFYDDNRPEAKRRRKPWVDFVSLHRKHWCPSKWSAVCSKLFKSDAYENMFSKIEGLKTPVQPTLKIDNKFCNNLPHNRGESANCTNLKEGEF